jgi:hypothetical protein
MRMKHLDIYWSIDVIIPLRWVSGTKRQKTLQSNQANSVSRHTTYAKE